MIRNKTRKRFQQWLRLCGGGRGHRPKCLSKDDGSFCSRQSDEIRSARVREREGAARSTSAGKLYGSFQRIRCGFLSAQNGRRAFLRGRIRFAALPSPPSSPGAVCSAVPAERARSLTYTSTPCQTRTQDSTPPEGKTRASWGRQNRFGGWIRSRDPVDEAPTSRSNEAGKPPLPLAGATRRYAEDSSSEIHEAAAP